MTRTDNSEVPSYQGLLRLDGRGFVVVGAGQGIGRQTCHALAQAGAKVFAIDNQEDLAKEVAAEIDGVPWSGDARDPAAVDEAVRTARAELGRIHGLVDIVGMARYTELIDTTDEDWDWTFDMVLRHVFLFSRAAGRAIAEDGGGSMVFVASVSGMTGAQKHAAYGAAKAGIISLVKSLAVELGPKGVRANAVAPGMVWTPRIAAYVGEKGRTFNERNAPLRRIAEPPDIAAAILFLSSDLAANITGQTLVVDSGVSTKFPYPMPDRDMPEL